MYPQATIRTRTVYGRPVILALEDNVIRLVGTVDLSAPKRASSEADRKL